MKQEDDQDADENIGKVERPISDIKSTAVVKYAAVRTPAKFYKLQNNTDLKLPPPSWLKETSPWKVLKGHWATSSKDSSTTFTSLHMASDFPDCIGEVDVVSDSENIKKLLKIPYNKSQVSMMVHRVGKTLLLDEFDIHRHFLWASKKEWDWLHKFYQQHVLQTLQHKEKAYCREAKSRNYLQHKNMLSKFLYHSVDDCSNPETTSDVESTHELAYSGENSPQKTPDPWPHAFPEEENEHFAHNHEFQRNVVWNFEDIRMLIGTDMPIFGGGTHPCVSLRLRDMGKPINVLTGLDYWLDNLMCNVPEVFMCYHLDGIVQKYELMKTEDIPQLKDSKFSPKVIKDVAQNILSFLKSKATKAGHTYWLFKGNDDEVVKLYDLTTLCADVLDDGECNPFTIPVAMLLYRVARNMKLSNPDPQCQGTICHLLKNCVSLLDGSKHPQVIISAHYLLSDLYMPDDLDVSALNSDNVSVDARSDKEVRFDTAKKGSVAASAQVKVEALCLSEIGDPLLHQSDNTDPPISGTVEERCKAALSHVAQGLSCLRDHISSKTCQSPKKDDVQKMAKSFEPIPLHYSPLDPAKDANVGQPSKSGSKINICDKKGIRFPMSILRQEWLCADTLLGCYARRLLLKATTTAYAFAAVLLKMGKVGLALKNIKLSSLCLECVESTGAVRNVKESCATACVVQQSDLLELAGDAQFMLVQQWHGSLEGHCLDYDSDDQSDILIAKCAKEFLGSDGRHEQLTKVGRGLEEILITSCECYKQALKVNREKRGTGYDDLKKRLGNIANELGVYYMNQALKLYDNEQSDGGLEALKKSLQHLESGLQAFEDVQDKANMALLNSNMGRLMRTYAHTSNIHDSTKALSAKERSYYEKAISCYQKALRCLTPSTSQLVEVRDTVTWELSCTFYSLATLLQDYAPLSSRPQIEVEREVSDLMNKALRYCESGVTGSSQQKRQNRVAKIHHLLGSLYHNSCRCQVGDETRRRHQRNLAEKHYLKSATLFALLENATEFLRVQLERVALMELQYMGLTSHAAKLKCLYGILELLLTVKSVEIDADMRADEANANEELFNLLNLFKQRLQFTLHQLIKISSGKDALRRNDPVDIYKQMYRKSLTLSFTSGSSLDQTRHLKDILGSIEESFHPLK